MSSEPEPEPDGDAAAPPVAVLEPLLQWFRSQPDCRLGEIEISEYEYQGRGVRAKSATKAGNPLFSCPVRMLFTARAAREEPVLGPALTACVPRDDDALALYILHERRKGAASAHAEHVAALPLSYDQTLFWTDTELAEITGSNVLSITAQLKAQTQSDYDALMLALAAFPDVAASDFSYDDYCWALASIWSRSMDLPVGSSSEDGTMETLRVIAPVADLFNTDATAPVCHGFDAQDSTLKLAASRDTQSGEQLVIGYGPVTNARCLWLYGFAIDNNPNDKVDLYAVMSPETSAYSKRLQLLTKLSIEALSVSTPHELSLAQPLPESLRQSLRVQRAPKKLLKVWLAEPEMVADGNVPDVALEREILEALRLGVIGMLGGYSTSLEEDEEIAARWCVLYPRTYRQHSKPNILHELRCVWD